MQPPLTLLPSMNLPVASGPFYDGGVFPTIDYELADLREKGLLSGTVLNVGCGWRDISKYVPGSLVNQDITWPGDTRTNVSIFSELHELPVLSESFDAVICLAVLEHVPNPVECTREIFRVLKPGGCVVASVPFMQPEHKVPGDYQRYTQDGLEKLFRDAGFNLGQSDSLFSVYQTLYWIVEEWLSLKDSLSYKAARKIILPILRWRAATSKTASPKIASAFRIVALKPASNGATV